MSFQTVLPVLTLIAGGLLQYLSQWGADFRQRKAAQEARDTERDRVRRDRRETFELDHLLRLNDALMRFGRAAGRVHNHDVLARQSGTYARDQRPTDINDEFGDAGREVISQMHLILDDSLQETVSRARDAIAEIGMQTPTTIPAEAVFARALQAHVTAMKAIGDRVRQIYLDQA